MIQNNVATSDPAETVELQPSPDTNTRAMIERISTRYQAHTAQIGTRDNKRIKFRDQVRICPANATGVPNGTSVIAAGRDLSLWGISLLSPQPFEVDTYLIVEFTLPGHADHGVTMLGQVRHVHSEDGGQLIGCEFTTTLSD